MSGQGGRDESGEPAMNRLHKRNSGRGDESGPEFRGATVMTSGPIVPKAAQPNGRTSAKERGDLDRLLRDRERFAAEQARARTAQLMADVEQQIAAIYKPDADAWRDVVQQAKAVVAAANEHIVEQCRDRGIPESLAPSLSLGWAGRGESAINERRGELRRVARTRLKAVEKAAVVEIQRQCLSARTAVRATGFASDEAKALLAALPDPESLMPPLDVASLQDQIPSLPDLAKSYGDLSDYQLTRRLAEVAGDD
jgi:hypothetical protein